MRSACAVFFALTLAPWALANNPNALPMMARITPRPLLSKGLAVRGGIRLGADKCCDSRSSASSTFPSLSSLESSAELATKLSCGSIVMYAAEMWFTEYANNKYAADKDSALLLSLSPLTSWWIRWFQMSLVQQVSIYGFMIASGADLTAICKASALNYALAGSRMIGSSNNMDPLQFKLNLAVMAVMMGLNLSGAGVF